VTFKRGLVNKVIWDWYDAVRTGRFKARNVSIVVHDTSGADDLVEFQLVDAFPVKWIGPELSAGGNNLAIESLEVAHQGLMRKK
jgi:phage tail-like protein